MVFLGSPTLSISSLLLLLNSPQLSCPLLISCRILVEAYEGHFVFSLSRCSNHAFNRTARSYRRSPYCPRNLGHRDPARRGTTGTVAPSGHTNPFINTKHPDLGPSCQPHCPGQRFRRKQTLLVSGTFPPNWGLLYLHQRTPFAYSHSTMCSAKLALTCSPTIASHPSWIQVSQ